MPPSNNVATPAEGVSVRSRFFNWVWNKVIWARGQFRDPTTQITNFLVNALGRLTKLIGKYPVESGRMGQEIENPQTPEDFKHNLDIIVRKSGLDEIFTDDSYLKKVADKAAQLKNDPNNLLKEPRQLVTLTKLALYQPVLYCDDSGSMAGETAIKNVDRKSAQAALVKRIASIITRAVPENEGVHLRFINRNDAYNDLNAAEIEAKMQITPSGGTLLGQNLRKKVLKPFVYDIVDNNERLARPLLILTITDGCPNKPDTFQKEIRDCGEYLLQKGYQKAAVRFDLSQIGNDKYATEFLQRLADDEEIRDVLHCTAEHLDDRFAELRDNEQELEGWLLDKLSKPVRVM